MYNGEILPVATYYFILDLGIEGEQPRKGTISLVR
jgi:hypothetical protein